MNLDRIQHWIDRGLLDPTRPITAAELLHSRCIHQVKDGVKLLAAGSSHLRTRISIIVSKASASAIEGVEAVGGSIECRFYNQLSLRALTKPDKWFQKGKNLPRPADPIKKKDLLYYSSPNRRGYLASRAIGRLLQHEQQQQQQDQSLQQQQQPATSQSNEAAQPPSVAPAS